MFPWFFVCFLHTIMCHIHDLTFNTHIDFGFPLSKYFYRYFVYNMIFCYIFPHNHVELEYVVTYFFIIFVILLLFEKYVIYTNIIVKKIGMKYKTFFFFHISKP